MKSARADSSLKWITWILGGLLCSCQSTQFTLRDPAKIQKTWRHQNIWARQSMAMENDGYRKIHRFTPILTADKVVVGNALDGLSAFDSSSGNLIWRLPFKDGIEASGSSIKDRLFVSGAGGGVFAVSISKGEIIWRYNLATEVLGAPLLIEDTVVVQTGSGLVVALDAVSGNPRWTINRNENSAINLSIRGASSAAYADGTLYMGFADGSLVALSAATGKTIWEIQLNKNKRFKDVDATPVIYKDSLIVSGFDEKIYRIDRKAGQVLWSAVGGGAFPALVQEDNAFVASSNGVLRSLNLKDGSENWKFQTIHGIMTTPALYKDHLVAGESQGGVVLINKKSGQLMDRFFPGRGVLAAPLVDEKKQKVYFISGEGNLYKINFELVDTFHTQEFH